MMTEQIYLVCCIVCLFSVVVRVVVKHTAYDPVDGLCIKIYFKTANNAIPFSIMTKSVYRYCYQNKTYEYTEKMFCGSKKMKMGNTYLLYVNRKNPSKCLTPADNTVTWAFLLLALSLLFFSKDYLWQLFF